MSPTKTKEKTISNKRLRECFEEKSITTWELSQLLEIPRINVERALGLKSHEGRFQSEMELDIVLRYLEALQLDPVDIGI